MEVLLNGRQEEFLKRTYPGMTKDQALQAFLNDSLNDTDLLDRAAERINDRRDWIASLVILGAIIFFAWLKL